MPMQKGRGAMANVDGNIEHLTAQAAYEFCLGMGWKLEMQAAHRAALSRQVVVDLYNAFAGSDQRSEVFCTIKPLQVATAVTQQLALDELQPLDRRY